MNNQHRQFNKFVSQAKQELANKKRHFSKAVIGLNCALSLLPMLTILLMGPSSFTWFLSVVGIWLGAIQLLISSLKVEQKIGRSLFIGSGIAIAYMYVSSGGWRALSK